MGINVARLLVRSARAWPSQATLAIGERVIVLARGLGSRLELGMGECVALFTDVHTHMLSKE